MTYIRWKIVTITILVIHAIGDVISEQNIINLQKTVETDNVAATDEHHKVVILVPQVVKPSKPKPHHGKHIPVVHTGKVIHAHHHDGKVSHIHSHIGKANHNHKHTGIAGHKHSHHGTGLHKHSHLGSASHAHKHAGHGDHAHKHFGKASVIHKHAGHGLHDHKHHGTGLHNHHHVGQGGHKGGKYAAEYGNGFPYLNIGSKSVRIIHPGGSFSSSSGDLLSGISTGSERGPGKIIQIRIPDEYDSNLVKEIDIDTESQIAIMKSKYINTPDDDYESLNINTIAADYLSKFEDDDGIEDHSTDGTVDTGYRFGEGYRLAAAAAEAALHDEQDDTTDKYPFIDENAGGFVPMIPKGNSGSYSDAYHYQY